MRAPIAQDAIDIERDLIDDIWLTKAALDISTRRGKPRTILTLRVLQPPSVDRQVERAAWRFVRAGAGASRDATTKLLGRATAAVRIVRDSRRWRWITARRSFAGERREHDQIMGWGFAAAASIHTHPWRARHKVAKSPSYSQRNCRRRVDRHGSGGLAASWQKRAISKELGRTLPR
jgi:hypothetical protein